MLSLNTGCLTLPQDEDVPVQGHYQHLHDFIYR